MAAKKKKKHLKKCCAHSRRILSTCHLKRHRTACDRLTREASGGCLAARQPWHLILLRHHIRGRERIKASVAFTSGETSKDDFAWWDNLVTTGVYVVLKCVCGTAALKIGSEWESELLLLPLSATFFTPSRRFVQRSRRDSKSAFEERGRGLSGAAQGDELVLNLDAHLCKYLLLSLFSVFCYEHCSYHEGQGSRNVQPLLVFF